MWIDLSDRDSEGNQVWSDASSVDYTNFGSGNPNNNNKDCVFSNGDWGWQSCTTSSAYVCEFPIDTTTNALLSSLSVLGYTLTPTFDANTASYAVDVPNEETTGNIVAVADSSSHHGITINSASYTSSSTLAASLSEGVNAFTIVVTAENTINTETYYLSINRLLSSNANISSVALSSTAISYEPTFNAGVYVYTAYVSNHVTSLDATVVAEDAAAEITVDGESIGSGATSSSISLAVGDTSFDIVCDSVSGDVSNTYTFTITRGPNIPSFDISTATSVTPSDPVVSVCDEREWYWSFTTTWRYSELTFEVQIDPSVYPLTSGATLYLLYDVDTLPTVSSHTRISSTDMGSGLYRVTTPAVSTGTHYFGMLLESPSDSDCLTAFTYQLKRPDPTISSINPSLANTDGGVTTLTVNGEDFVSDSTVSIGVTPCPTTSVAYNKILCIIPEGQGKTFAVKATNPSPQVADSNTDNIFSYNKPSVSGVSWVTAPTSGGTSVVISGSNFGTSGSVTVGGEPCPDTEYAHGEITCTLPEGEGTASIQVTVATQTLDAFNSPTIDYDNPTVTSASPLVISEDGGETLHIIGTNFGSAFVSNGNTVTIGGTACDPVTFANHTVIECTTPSGSGPNQAVVVTVSGASSGNSVKVSYPGPTITSVSGSSFPTAGGVDITLRGTAFGASGTAYVDGLQCTQSHWNETTVVCSLPSSEGAVFAQVIVAGQVSNLYSFSYDAPVVSGVNPAGGSTVGGYTLTVEGINFGDSPTASVDGKACTVASSNETHLLCSAPQGSGSNVSVIVTASSRTSSGWTQFVYTAPAISNVDPNPATTKGGVLLTISGTNFHQYSTGSVTVGDVACVVPSPGVYSHTEIQCVLPKGDGTGHDVVVTVADQASPAANFDYSAPSILSVSPVIGGTEGGRIITIVGTEFSTSGTITIDGEECDPTGELYTTTRIECATPAGSGGPHDVVVAVNGQSDSFSSFTYNAPVISSISPSSGWSTDGTTVLTLEGSNFFVSSANPARATTVDVGGSDCPVIDNNHTFIQCTVPAGAGTAVQVSVLVDGRSTTSSASGSYATPSITGVTGCDDSEADGHTRYCATDGSSSITLTGTNFGSDAALLNITIGGELCAAVAMDTAHTVFTCSPVAATGTNVAVRIYVDGQSSAEYTGVSFRGPSITTGTLQFQGGSPASPLGVSDVHGGQTIEFQGKYFGTSATVTYGPETDTSKYTCTVNSGTSTDTFIECDLDPGVGKDLRLVVHDNGSPAQSSPISVDLISYPAPEYVNFTIRTPPDAAGSSTGSVSGGSNTGELIYFDALHVGSVADDVEVFYGTSGSDPYEYECGSVSLTGPNEESDVDRWRIQCATAEGDGTNYVFVVRAGNQESAESEDRYSYPQTPLIYSVEGCTVDPDNSNRTINCPTDALDESEDQILLTITGEHFGTNIYDSGISISVGTATCGNIASPTPGSVLTCELPAGSGINQAVRVVSGGLFSPRETFVDYASATITSVQGCPTDEGSTTTDCARTGGDIITISGDNFGVSGATVLVGTSQCTSLSHNSTTPHTSVSCTVPAGGGTDPVFLIQSGGRLSSSSGEVSFEPCAAGSYEDPSDGTNCLLCEPGSFTSTVGQLSCTECESGFYAANNGSTSCLPCGVGTYSVRSGGNGPSTCIDCLAGKYADQEQQTACRPCDAGKHSSLNQSDYCETCPAGKFSEDGAQECTNCSAGWYSLADGSSSCLECDLGLFSDEEGMSSCSVCVPGTYTDDVGSTVCLNCTTGTATDASGQSVCPSCNAGFFANETGLTACFPCGAGKFQSSQGQSECNPCDEGKYNPSPGQVVCVDCPVGSFCNETQMTSPYDCPAGYVADESQQTSCSPCDEGKYSPTSGNNQCLDCPVGRFTNMTASTTCQVCSIGSFASSSMSTVCDPCPQGTATSASGQSICVDCPAGSFSGATGAQQCTQCPKGSSTDGDTRSTGCTLCTPGYFTSLAGQAECEECPVGKYSNSSGSTFCFSCDVGMYNDLTGKTICNPCDVGTFADDKGSFECTNCEIGTFADRNQSSSCTACPAGKVQPASGSSTCNNCTEGWYIGSKGEGVCVVCSVGRFSDSKGATECDSCEPGTYQNVAGKSSCKNCTLGSATRSFGQALCSECEAGEYADVTGLTTCLKCETGKTSSKVGSKGASSCTNCTVGRFVGAKGQSVCLQCSVGTFSPSSGASFCLACEVGKFSQYPGRSTCTDCPVGRFTMATGALSCEDCPSGSFTNVTGSTTCRDCPVGTFQISEGSDQCDSCPPGEFNGGVGAIECLPCEPGSYTNEYGDSECTDCQLGKYQDRYGATACVFCSSGKFAGVEATKLCTSCPQGSYANVTGLSACTDCDPGLFEDDIGSSVCDECSSGRYNPSSGQKECLLCPAGTFSNDTGIRDCLDCPRGSFQTHSGSSSCEFCPLGKYMPSTGQEACLDCPEGRFVASFGATVCDACPAGTAQPNPGRTQCSECEAGFFALEAQIECSVCTSGTFTPFERSTECIPCGANSRPDFFKTTCECDRGYYFPDHLQQEVDEVLQCVSCPDGANCDDEGTLFTTMEAKSGWWRSHTDDTYFLRCLVRAHCAGGRGTLDPETGEYSGSRCASNRGDVLCAICLPGYYATAGGTCTECPTRGSSWLFFLFIGILVVLLVWVQLYVILKSGDELITSALAQIREERERVISEITGLDTQRSGINIGGDALSDSDEAFSDAVKSTHSIAPVGDAPTFSVDADVSGVEEYERKSTGDDAEDSEFESSDSEYDEEYDDAVDDIHQHEAVRTKVGAGPGHIVVRAQQGKNILDMPSEDANGNVLTIHGPPLPPANFTYSLKIFLGFLQIVSNVASGLEIQWPSKYEEFALYFDVANFDFIVESSFACVDSLSYYRTFLVIVLTPLATFLLIGLFYLVPRYYGVSGQNSEESKFRSSINFWRMFLYIMFLIYPGVSSTVLRLYICKYIFGKHYLLTDVRVECYTETWTVFAFASIALVLLYPIGIPAFFYTLLRINRDELHEDRVKAQIGFLYGGYRKDVWWFEIADSIHKLTLTSMLAFFPRDSQLPVGMSVAILYLIVLLQVDPYIRKSNDVLHMLCQIEIFLLLMAGNVIYNQDTDELAAKEDLYVSLVLIFITCMFIAFFLFQGSVFIVRVIKGWIQDWKKSRASRREGTMPPCTKDEKEIEMESGAPNKDKGAAGPHMDTALSTDFQLSRHVSAESEQSDVSESSSSSSESPRKSGGYSPNVGDASLHNSFSVDVTPGAGDNIRDSNQHMTNIETLAATMLTEQMVSPPLDNTNTVEVESELKADRAKEDPLTPVKQAEETILPGVPAPQRSTVSSLPPLLPLNRNTITSIRDLPIIDDDGNSHTATPHSKNVVQPPKEPEPQDWTAY